MNILENKTFDEERALYGSHELTVKHCAFDGLADGESALKECADITIQDCFFNLRYPFWHNNGLKISDSRLTSLCRAAIWYSHHIEINDTGLHGTKALRECSHILIHNADIISPEFGWSVSNMRMDHTDVIGEYFMLRSQDLLLQHINLQGKYSFQYVKNAVFENCKFDTKDAFWHCENVIVRNSVLRGEYLGWYASHLTLENCKIIGTQPLCYCKNLKLVSCEMVKTDLCFEKSELEATITTPVDSIKNPYAGRIFLPEIGELILDDENAKAEVILTGQKEEQK